MVAKRRRRVVRAGRGRGDGELHRPVPDGRRAPPPHGRRRAGSRDPRRRRPGLRLPRRGAGAARPPRDPGPDAEPGRGRHQRVHEHHRRRPGWRNLAIWAMPPIAYALASDTLISVVRVIVRHQDLAGPDAGDTATPLAAIGGLILWLLRLTLAPASTLAGFRAWVLAECPTAPARRAPPPQLPPPPPPAAPPARRSPPLPRPVRPPHRSWPRSRTRPRPPGS